MTFGYVRQAVRGLERKFLEYFHVTYPADFISRVYWLCK